MNQIKKIFGTILTLLGLVGLGLSVIQYISISTETLNTQAILTVGGLAFLLFISGIGLSFNRRDEI
jgi:hypothetical protein